MQLKLLLLVHLGTFHQAVTWQSLLQLLVTTLRFGKYMSRLSLLLVKAQA
jgi:hypothetical protein